MVKLSVVQVNSEQMNKLSTENRMTFALVSYFLSISFVFYSMFLFELSLILNVGLPFIFKPFMFVVLFLVHLQFEYLASLLYIKIERKQHIQTLKLGR